MHKEPGRSNPFTSAEFMLVCFLLLALLLVILMIFTLVTGTDATATQASRKDLLAIILGAFGAWIGAGAAYFFGRENLRAATDSMLKMRAVTPQERLMQTALGNMKLDPMPKTFKIHDFVEAVVKWLKDDADRFFVVIVRDDETVDKAVEAEGVYRYLVDHPNIDQTKVELEEVIKYIKEVAEDLEKKGEHEKAQHLKNHVDCAIVLKDSESAWVANEMMMQRNVFVTVVVNEKGLPVGIITPTNIRSLIVSSTS